MIATAELRSAFSIDQAWARAHGRCTMCGFHPTQGHRSAIDGSPTGCNDSGPLGVMLARQRRDTGMSMAEKAHPNAVALIDAAIMRRVRSGRPFSANTIREELHALSPNERPCIGARMNSLARKHCRKVGDEVSTDPGTHGKTVGVWVAKGAAA